MDKQYSEEQLQQCPHCDRILWVEFESNGGAISNIMLRMPKQKLKEMEGNNAKEEREGQAKKACKAGEEERRST